MEKLVIKQLSNSGELIKVITCYAGQISVFRATSQAALKPFQRAVAGVPGPERFSISVDEKQFSPEDRCLIGFGEYFTAEESQRTPHEVLRECGISIEAISSHLMTYGLDKVEHKKISSLTPDEDRRLQILQALSKADKVLILNDPFDPMTSQWRERFADLLSSHARNAKRIIVVTSLSQRPDSWIDNETIARIQVGEAIQKTIGFGSGNHELANLVNKIRSEAVPPSHQEPSATAKEEVKSNSFGIIGAADKDRPKPSGTNTTIMLLACFLILALGIYVGIGLLPQQSIQVSRIENDLHKSESASHSSIISSAVISSESAIISSSNPVIVSTATEKNYVLNLYPEIIRRSIIDGFEGTQKQSPPMPSTLRSPRLSRENIASAPIGTTVNNDAADLLNVLERTSNVEDNTATFEPQIENENSAELSPEQRREVIRQRFLEAIQRAAQTNSEN